MKGRQTFVQEDLCPNRNLKSKTDFCAKKYNQESALQWIPFRKRYHSKLTCRSWGRQWQPKIFTNPLQISESYINEGAAHAHHIITAPSDFKTFLRPMVLQVK